jgi:SAM-dependent methyltransferase
MKNYKDSTYGQRIAEIYDDFYTDFDPLSIDMLSELARGGPALELGIGTGRIALPLHECGVKVYGIDASEAMIARLRAKPRGSEIEVSVNSFADFKMDMRFNLIYVVFNTFFALLTQDEQLRCFQSVREHLAPDGVFLLEVFVPDLCRFVDHQTVRLSGLSEDLVNIDVSEVDPVTQTVSAQHIYFSVDGTRIYPVKLRYAWPSELDLMAQIAGLQLRHRWGSWSQAEFTKESNKHISVYSPMQ